MEEEGKESRKEDEKKRWKEGIKKRSRINGKGMGGGE